jgi:hypothetical protein
MSNSFTRLRQRRWFRVCALLGIALLTPLLLAWPYIDWSGARRLAAIEARLEREGESTDIRKIAPDPVPDDQNFFAIPALKDLALYRDNDATGELGQKFKRLIDARLPSGASEAREAAKVLQAARSGQGVTALASMSMSYVPMPNPSHNAASLGQPTDLKAWADWLRYDGSLKMPPDSGNPARDVLAALSVDDALIGELALGMSRPESQWTPAWKTRAFPENPLALSLPYYAATQGLTHTLVLRSTAAARAGDAVKAHQSLLIAVRLNQAYIQEPLAIGALVACGQSALIDSAVWELCDAHAGTAEDFRALQQALLRVDFRAAYLCAERGELAGGIKWIEYYKRNRDASLFDALNVSDETAPTKNGIFSMGLRLIPAGLYDANAATGAEWHYDYFIKPLRDAGFPELLARQKELQALVTAHRNQPSIYPDELLPIISMSALFNVSTAVVYAQSADNRAIAACALERYRIEHGAYPETLEAANHPGEEPIPLDIISGKPMGYRKTPDGRYALWCIAFTGKDNGGKRVLDKENPELTRFRSPDYLGDWVWDFPAQ